MGKHNLVATWSKLPKELLDIIVGRLTCFIDYVRFGAVCRSWRSSILIHLTSLHPWLLLPEGDKNFMIRGFNIFYNGIIFQMSVFELMLPEARAMRCVGSSKGWLVMVDEGLSIHLFNPCTRVQFQLPHQRTFQDYYNILEDYYEGYNTEETPDIFIQKVVLSSSPSNPNYIAMAIYSDLGKLAIARPGDEEWTTISSEWSAFCDVIYYKEQFYAVNCHGVVVSCDVDAHPKTTLITATVNQSYGQWYLVECSGELLQVMREINYKGDFPDYRTKGFSVFKLDFCSQLRIEMKSLGDQSLFLGYNTSFSFCCNNSPVTGIKRDCIYFTDGFSEEHFLMAYNGRDRGVFHLEDGDVEPHWSGYVNHPFLQPIWFTPNK